jgi:CMP-N,N'-diacetyllegionaminic acid synthase
MSKALVIGYGSIGRRHAKVLKDIKKFDEILILTSQKIKEFKTIKSIQQIKTINPDYIVISKPTSEHFKYLDYCENYLRGKLILIEKPLFDKINSLKIKKNKVFVGYNLRFHPVIKKLKKELKNKDIFNVHIQNSSFLPEWRNTLSYDKTSSAQKKMGGGVLLDLSHELDFIRYLFGNFKIISGINKRISQLKINTDDILNFQGIIKKNKTSKILINVNLNFFSRFKRREIICDGKYFSIKGDLNSQEVLIKEKKKLSKIIYKDYKQSLIDKTYIDLHNAVLNQNNLEALCTVEEGVELMKNINMIQKKLN